MLAALFVGLSLAAGAPAPHDAVLRFIENRSPADACAQLAPAYKASLAASYGPCLAGMRRQPKALRVKVLGETITASKATVRATYVANSTRFNERYRLSRIEGRWLITDAAQI